MIGGYEQLWKAIIRPPRAEYTIADLGSKTYKRHSVKTVRTDLELTNQQGLKLQCSHYQPQIRPCRELPCVIYLHGNASCRLEAYSFKEIGLDLDITLFAFDFAGCGLSEGEYISLGYFERGDVDTVFKHLRGLGTVSSIGIWGRSMGAVTALMYADTNHEIGCLVLDSPFSNLEKLSKELAEKHGGGLSIFSGIALSFLKSTIKEKHNFNIQHLDPIGKHVKKAYIPAFFIHGKEDDFIMPHHSEQLYAAYGGQDKRIKIVTGDHNSDRPQQLLDEVATFFYYGLCVGDLVKEDKAFIEEQKKGEEKKENGEKPKENFQFEGAAYDFQAFQDEEEDMLRRVLEMSLLDEKKKAAKQKKQEEKK